VNENGFFSIDSYATTINTGELKYSEKLSYKSINEINYNLFNVLDFRPSNYNNEIESTIIPLMGSVGVFNIEYYQGRIDLLCIDKNGIIYVKPGNYSDTPVAPNKTEEEMALYEIHLNPYTYSLNDIKTKYIENKRYTMRDIGKIEDRIKRLEYYTSLSILEKSAQDMSIKDANGLDRFKNGFVADNFGDFQAADTTSSDFKASLDRKRKELRPSFTSRNKKLIVDKKLSTAKFIGQMAINDYDSYVIDKQPFATKHISVNPYFQYRVFGEMVLMPRHDTWVDTETKPNVNVNIDTGVAALNEIAQNAGTVWGEWSQMNRTIETSENLENCLQQIHS
jgi:hypothetical protein